MKVIVVLFLFICSTCLANNEIMESRKFSENAKLCTKISKKIKFKNLTKEENSFVEDLFVVLCIQESVSRSKVK